jgi:hypothetical protein
MPNNFHLENHILTADQQLIEPFFSTHWMWALVLVKSLATADVFVS